MHGADSALKQPRAFYIGGVDSTSCVLSGQTWQIPVAGTMAHSYVLAFPSEIEAFRHFVRTYPETILLVDTYDTKKGVDLVIQLARELGDEFRVSGVRLDSGDLARHAWDVRRQLDFAGLSQVKIFVSSSLDEYEIQKLVAAGVPINGFGVGGNLATSSDVPVLDTAYKLTEYAGTPKMKLSESKSTLPGRKQVFRQTISDKAVRDVIGLKNEKGVPGDPLLIQVMLNGRRTQPVESLELCRTRCKTQRSSLPDVLMSLSKVDPGYAVEVSSGVKQLQEQILKSL